MGDSRHWYVGGRQSEQTVRNRSVCVRSDRSTASGRSGNYSALETNNVESGVKDEAATVAGKSIFLLFRRTRLSRVEKAKACKGGLGTRGGGRPYQRKRLKTFRQRVKSNRKRNEARRACNAFAGEALGPFLHQGGKRARSVCRAAKRREKKSGKEERLTLKR